MSIGARTDFFNITITLHQKLHQKSIVVCICQRNLLHNINILPFSSRTTYDVALCGAEIGADLWAEHIFTIDISQTLQVQAANKGQGPTTYDCGLGLLNNEALLDELDSLNRVMLHAS